MQGYGAEEAARDISCSCCEIVQPSRSYQLEHRLAGSQRCIYFRPNLGLNAWQIHAASRKALFIMFVCTQRKRLALHAAVGELERMENIMR